MDLADLGAHHHAFAIFDRRPDGVWDLAQLIGIEQGPGVEVIAHLADAVICGVGYLFPLWDAKRQTLADKMMSTVCLPIGQDHDG